MATASNGRWFGIIRQVIIDYKIFRMFSRLLKQIQLMKEKNKQKFPIIILDNACIHSSYNIKEVTNKLKLDLKLFLPYCQEIALVEHIFRAIKSKLRLQISAKLINFGRVTKKIY